MDGPEVVLIGSVGSPPNVTGSQWCQQYPSHSTGDLAFGVDRAFKRSFRDVR
jgi:hypothetical protein